MDSDALRRWLVANVADVPDESITLDVIGGGASNMTIGAHIGHRDLIVRRPPVGAFLPSANDVRREYTFLSALAATPVPTPATLAFCEDDAVLGAPFYVMERLAGVVPHDPTPLVGMSASEGRRLSERLVDVLVELHAVDVDAVGLGGVAKRTGYLERQVRRWVDQWGRSKDGHDETVIDELARILQHALPNSPPSTIVHGDYRLGNVIVDADDRTLIVGVLDWEMATLGDPLADLGYTLLYWGGRDRPPIHPSQACADLPGFLSADELTERYANASGRPVADVTFYVVLAAFKLTIIGAGNRARHRRTGNASTADRHGFQVAEWALDLWRHHEGDA